MYHDGFAFSQETPFSFRSAEEFSCDENRGTPDSPLFLLNHFLTPPTAAGGEAANDPTAMRIAFGSARRPVGRW